MTARAYNLNTEYAREGSGGAGQRITESGKYVGTITQARHVEASTGSQGIEINFEDKNGATANYMTLWTRNAQGEAIYGEKRLHALMTCLKVKNIEPVRGKAEVYKDGQMVEEAADLYPALMDKPIGFLLQGEEYLGQNGVKKKMTIYMPFNAETGQTAQEILDQTEGKTVDKVAGFLKDKLLQKSAPQGDYSAPTEAADDFSDEIPF